MLTPSLPGWLCYINVTVGMDKPLARLKVVRRLSVDKGQVLWPGILVCIGLLAKGGVMFVCAT